MTKRWLLSLVIGGAVLALPMPADAATYRYWSYWNDSAGTADWTFATAGPGTTRPADGSVEAWRFGTSSGTATASPPRSTARFDDICAGVARADGTKRVGLVIDYGTADQAPPGEQPPGGVRQVCAVVPESATGARVLASQASVRTKDGLVCGIDGYPRSECAVTVAEGSASDPVDRAAPARTGATAASPQGSTNSAATDTRRAPGASAASGPSDAATQPAPPSPRTATTTSASPTSAAPTLLAGDVALEEAADPSGRLPVPLAAGVVALAVAVAWGVDRARRRSRR